MQERETRATSRREFVKAGVAAALALPVVPALLAGCGSGEQQAPEKPAAAPEAKPAAAPPAPPAAPAAPPAAAAAPAAGGGEGQLVTDVPAMAVLVSALQYTHHSSKPGQSCSNCQFYTPQTGGRGRCQMFAQGLVEEGGWCTSWTKKVTTG